VTIAGSILAGGQSRRMGEDKSFLVLGGTPLIERAIDRLRPQVGQLILNVHQDTKELGAYGLPIVEDADGDHQGPLAGLLASLRWAETQGIPWIATAAVDTPFFPKDLVARLEAASQDKTMAAARSGGRLHPVFGLWRSELASALGREMGQGLRSLHQWVALHDAGIADWPTRPYDPFFNINRPEDVTKASQILNEHAP
jgi:molybdopterin-guanine dinucleotide biosynthesis protein A